MECGDKSGESKNSLPLIETTDGIGDKQRPWSSVAVKVVCSS